MNRRSEDNAGQRWRWSNGGNTTLARYGAGYFGSLSRGTGLNRYGSDDGARRIRASDLARRKVLSDSEWAVLMAKREQMFGLEPGSLTTPRVAPATKGNER